MARKIKTPNGVQLERMAEAISTFTAVGTKYVDHFSFNDSGAAFPVPGLRLRRQKKDGALSIQYEYESPTTGKTRTISMGAWLSEAVPNVEAIHKWHVEQYRLVCAGQDPHDHSAAARRKQQRADDEAARNTAEAIAAREAAEEAERQRVAREHTVHQWWVKWFRAAQTASKIPNGRINDKRPPGADLQDSLKSIWFRWCPEVAAMPITAITADYVGELMQRMRDEEVFRFDDRYPEGHRLHVVGHAGQDTLSRVLSMLRNVVLYAYDAKHPDLAELDKKVLNDPTLSKKIHKSDNRRRGKLNRYQLKAFWSYLDLENSETDRALAWQILTGCRRIEVAGDYGVEWSNYDPEEETITVKRTKNGIPLVIALNDQMMDILIAQQEHIEQRRKANKTVKRNEVAQKVFTLNGSYQLYIRTAEIRAELQKQWPGLDFVNHSLRATFGYLNAIELGLPQQTVDSCLNHKESGVGAVSYGLTTTPKQRKHVWSEWGKWVQRHLIEDQPFVDAEDETRVDPSRKAKLKLIQGGRAA